MSGAERVPATGAATVLVTGASGYLARHVVRDLLAEGFAVRGTVREPTKADAARAALAAAGSDVARLDFALADLGADAGWAAAAAGCRFAIHVASPFPLRAPRRAEALIVPARDGTRRVVGAALAAGCERIVVTSSIAAACYGRPGDPAHPYTEDDWTPADDDALPPYVRSKAAAERTAWEAAGAAQGRLAVLNPGFLLGPILGPSLGGGVPTSVELVRRLLDGSLPAVPRFGFAVADVRDVAAMHVAALAAPDAAGRRLLLAGPFHWTAEIAACLAAALPAFRRRIPSRTLPDWCVRLAALVDPGLRAGLFTLNRRTDIACGAAERALGWRPRPLKATLADTAHALIEAGIVRAPRS